MGGLRRCEGGAEVGEWRGGGGVSGGGVEGGGAEVGEWKDKVV